MNARGIPPYFGGDASAGFRRSVEGATAVKPWGSTSLLDQETGFRGSHPGWEGIKKVKMDLWRER